MPSTNHESRPRQHVRAILRAGPVDEDDRRMFAAGGRRDQRAGQLHVAIREPHVFPFFDLDAFRSPRRRTVMLPRQRDNLAGAVALKGDARLDRGGQRRAGAGEKLVTVGRIQRAHITGLVKRHQLRRPESAELVPHLQVDECVRSPLVNTRVFTKSVFIERMHDGSLTHRNRDESAEKGHDKRCADHHYGSGSSTHLNIIKSGLWYHQHFVPSRSAARIGSQRGISAVAPDRAARSRRSSPSRRTPRA